MRFLQMKTIKKTFLLSLLIGTSSAHAKSPLDLNDLSYMWPPVMGTPLEDQHITASQVLPKTIFDELIAFSRGKDFSGIKLENPIHAAEPAFEIQNWKVVSMRIDPCAPASAKNLGAPTECLQEMRLVLQPTHYDGVWEIYDFSIHALFEIDSGKPENSLAFRNLLDQVSLLKDMNQKLDITTDGQPLRVHPGFKNPDFPTKIQDMVLETTKKSRLKKLTFSGALAEEGPWVFFQGLVQDGHYVLQADKTLQGSPFGHISPALPNQGGTIEPLPSNLNDYDNKDHGQGPSILDLFSTKKLNLQDMATLPNGDKSAVFKLGDLIVLFDNPKLSNRENTDCFSCHTSMSRGMLMGIYDQHSRFQFESPESKYNLKPIFPNSTQTNFRMFGWFGSRPVIAPRVINESVEAAEIIRKFY